MLIPPLASSSGRDSGKKQKFKRSKFELHYFKNKIVANKFLVCLHGEYQYYIIINIIIIYIIINADEDLSLQIKSFAMINLRDVSTKLYFKIVAVTTTYQIQVNQACPGQEFP